MAKSRSALRLRAFIIASDEVVLRAGQYVTFIVSPSPDMRNATARTSTEVCVAITSAHNRFEHHVEDGRRWSFRGRLGTRIELIHGHQKLILEIGQRMTGELTITSDQDVQGWMLDNPTAYEMRMANDATSARADAYYAALMEAETKKKAAETTGGAGTTEEGPT